MGQHYSTPAKNQGLRINHPKFENPTFLRSNNTDEEYFQIMVPVVDQKQYNGWAAKLNDKGSPLIRKESLMLPRDHSFHKEGLCGSSGFVKIDYDNFTFLLSDQIKNRQSINHKQFQQTQLWYLLYTLISTAKDFHIRGLKVGDIRPSNIFINQDGQIKMATHLSWPGQSSNYTKTLFEKEPTYLSPEEIKDVQFGKGQSSFSPESSESFSIGLTCLDAALLQDSTFLYNKNGKFDYASLEDKIRRFTETGYSELFSWVVSSMCETQAEDRVTSNQIYQWLIPHEDTINNLENFQVNFLPDRVEHTRLKQTGQQIYPSQGSQIRSTINPNLVFSIDQAVRTGPPMTIQQVRAHQRGHQILSQPPLSQRISGQIVPQSNTLNQYSQLQNVSGSSIPGQRVVYQPMPPPQFLVQKQDVFTHQRQTQVQRVKKAQQNGSLVERGSQAATVSGSSNRPQPLMSDHKSKQYNKTLQKIDQQLQLSRKMFPS